MARAPGPPGPLATGPRPGAGHRPGLRGRTGVGTLRANTAVNRVDACAAGRKARRIYLPGGDLPSVGARLVQADLGATLERIAANGPAEMVDGRTARAILALYGTTAGPCGQRTLSEVRPAGARHWSPASGPRAVHATPRPSGTWPLCAAWNAGRLQRFRWAPRPRYVHQSSSRPSSLTPTGRYPRPGRAAAAIARLIARPIPSAATLEDHDRAGTAQVSGPPNEDTITLATVDGRATPSTSCRRWGPFSVPARWRPVRACS